MILGLFKNCSEDLANSSFTIRMTNKNQWILEFLFSNYPIKSFTCIHFSKITLKCVDLEGHRNPLFKSYVFLIKFLSQTFHKCWK